MAMGECSAYTNLQADSNVKFAAWRTSSEDARVNSRIWLRAVHDL